MFYRLAIAGMLFTTMSLTAVQATRVARKSSSSSSSSKRSTSHPMNCTPQLAMPMLLPMLSLPPPPLPALIGGETSLVHVAPSMSAVDVLHLIKMSLDEHVHAVDGTLVHDDAARVLLGHASELGPLHPTMDITIDGAHSERHVVVFANSAR